ncbi:MAG TPA: HAMP domain-containing sensor histidine kinase [Bryobacteraceae bacterium]|nr:HAMP domain-containing sensor histidine kinase [Bryobacteraceae bacterium]
MDVSDLSPEALLHDLNNVFQTILESAGALQADPKWKKTAATLTRSANRGRRIVGSINESSRSSGDLAPVAESAIQFAQDYLECIRAAPVNFSCDIEPGFRLTGISAAWERVLVNLLLNSAQAGATRVSIAAREREIAIEDDGPGISCELLLRIFEPHVSTKSTMSGLGLSIVRSIVEKNGGTVTAANREGGGAVFTIRLHRTAAA